MTKKDILQLAATIQSYNIHSRNYNKKFGVYYNRISRTFNYFYMGSRFLMNKLQREMYSKEIFLLLKSGKYSYQKTIDGSRKWLKLKPVFLSRVNNEYDVIIYDEELWDLFTIPEMI